MLDNAFDVKLEPPVMVAPVAVLRQFDGFHHLEGPSAFVELGFDRRHKVGPVSDCVIQGCSVNDS